MDIVDSNIIIYHSKPDPPLAVMAVMDGLPAFSRISELEVLGYPKITPEDVARIEASVAEFLIEEVSPEVIRRAVSLRQQKRISVPDSIIAATALLKGYRLVTRNSDDFDWIPGLLVYNPFDAPPAP